MTASPEIIQRVLVKINEDGGGESIIMQWIQNRLHISYPYSIQIIREMIYTLGLVQFNAGETGLVLTEKGQIALLWNGGYPSYLEHTENIKNEENETRKQQLELLIKTNRDFDFNKRIAIGSLVIAIVSAVIAIWGTTRDVEHPKGNQINTNVFIQVDSTHAAVLDSLLKDNNPISKDVVQKDSISSNP